MNPPSRPQSLAARQPSAVGTGCVRLFFGVFLLAGLTALYLGTIRPMLRVAAALRWEETPCVIDSSHVVEVPSTGKGRPAYRVEIVYHYTFHGGDHIARLYQFTSVSTAGRVRKQRIVDQYPPGRQTVCYVNPSAPAEAVIDRGPTIEMVFGCFGLIFVFIGGMGVFFSGRVQGVQQTTSKNAVPVFTPASGEPMVLKPQITPLGKFLGLLAFAIVWNGFISIFVYLMFFSPAHSNVPLFAKLFIGLFVLIGVLVIGGVCGSFLALFNPRIELTARTNAVPLGGELQFQWSIRGRAEKLHKIRLFLEGREEASYHSAKRMHTITQVFVEIPVFESTDREIISQGQARVVVPTNLMHTFRGAYNRISWRLRVQAEVPHWPNIEQEHTINVLPHRPTA